MDQIDMFEKLLVWDRNARKQMIIIETVSWKNIFVYKSWELDRNTWYHITVCKQMIIV